MTTTITTTLQSALKSLPPDAQGHMVDALFSPPLLEALGFESGEIYPKYNTGRKIVDQAARKTLGGDVFLHTKSNPYLLLEVKGRHEDLSPGATDYQKAVEQLKGYFFETNCKKSEWGIITNSFHIQLFRKHGKVIFPATQCIALNEDNIDEVITSIRKKIEKPDKALKVAVYNNKGGVGKTTTTVNLAGILTVLGKKVLAIDFDPNQYDLTKSLGFKASKGTVFDALTKKDVELRSAIVPYFFKTRKAEYKFDVIPTDSQLTDELENMLAGTLKLRTLHQKLAILRQEYDYILIDSPPNWKLFSQMAVYAADVVLIPTKHNSFFSLENAATVLKKFIPDIQDKKRDGSPLALSIFFNGEKTTEPQLEVAQKEIDKILTIAKKEGFNLVPFFYPRYTKAKKDLHIHEVPSYAHIAGAAFARVPAVYKDKFAHEYYKSLAKEYFLQ